MRTIVGGLATEYSLQGNGELVVLLHGWGDSSRGFHQIQDHLSKNYRVMALNLPGFGGSEAPLEPWDLTDFATHVGETLKKLNLDCYAFIGHSNGGAILIRGLANKSLQAKKLIVLATAAISSDNSRRKKTLQLFARGGKLLTAPLPATTKRKLRRKTYQVVGSDVLAVEQLHETFKKIVADDIRADAELLHVPTLLIYGEEDNATPLRYGKILNRAISGSRLDIISGAGHFIHLDYSALVITKIEDFLQ